MCHNQPQGCCIYLPVKENLNLLSYFSLSWFLCDNEKVVWIRKASKLSSLRQVKGSVKGRTIQSLLQTSLKFNNIQPNLFVGAMDNSSNNECPLMSLNTTKSFKIPMYSIILAFILPLNILAFWALIYQLKKSIVLSVYIMNLVVAHLLQILTLTFWMYYSHNNHQWSLGKAACLLIGVVFHTNFYSKNSFLCLITMERYLSLVHPLRFHRAQTIPGSVKISILVWLLILTLCAIGIGLQVHTFEQERKTCVDSSTLSPDYAMFWVSIMAFSFIIPLFLMAFFHVSVLFKVRQMVSLEKRVKMQISRFISLLIMAFLLLFTPYQVMLYYRYLLKVKTPSAAVCDSLRAIFVYEHATLCLSLLDNILDPLFYNLLLKDIQTDFRKCLFSRASRKRLLSEAKISWHYENTRPDPSRSLILRLEKSIITEPICMGEGGEKIGMLL